MGTTGRGTTGVTSPEVHPHSRGDNRNSLTIRVRPVGTPPLAWGQQPVRTQRHPKWRYTPTRVGTTIEQFQVHVFNLVHPHSRGDNASIPIRMRLSRGTPPLAWGQRVVRECLHRDIWYTPTRVGTTLEWAAHSGAESVHPHSRGDNVDRCR